MGLRSFLGAGKRKKNDPSSNRQTKKKNSPKPTKQTAKEPTPESTTPKRGSLRMGEDKDSGELNVHALKREESIQDRLNRVKSGTMTEDEKRAFLQTALSGGSTAESRKPLRTPLASESERLRASPFPADSIMRDIARGSKSEIDSHRKKQEYLELVTRPDRFGRLGKTGNSASSPGVGVSPVSGSSRASFKTPVDDIKSLDSNAPAAINSVSPPENSSFQFQPQPATAPGSGMPPDLGARLGAAAMANENLRQKQEKERQEEEVRQEAGRREMARKAEEMARMRQEQMARQQEEIQRRKRQEEEEAARVKAELERQEQERLQELMKVQDDYWRKKLGKEKEAKMKRQQQEEVEEKVAEVAASIDPEMDLLDTVGETPEVDLAENQEIAAPSRLSLNDVQNMERIPKDNFETVRDDELDEQLRRLKALNSPLPAPPAPQTTAAPISSSAAPFEPQRRSTSSKGSFRPAMDSLNSPLPAPPAPQTAAAPLSSSAAPFDPQTRSTSSKGSFRPALGSLLAGINEARSPAKAVGNEQQVSTRKSVPQPSIQQDSPPTSSIDPPPVAKGSIRMKLPLGDDELDEDEDGVDVRANKSMSIADAMKKSSNGGDQASQEERSKKWGIDMSRFGD